MSFPRIFNFPSKLGCCGPLALVGAAIGAKVGVAGIAAAGVKGALVAGAIGSSLDAKRAASKAAKGISAPNSRSYYGEMSEALEAQRAILPEIGEAERDAMPMYRQLQEESLMGQLGTMENLYSRYAPAGAAISQRNLAAMAPSYQTAAGMARDAYMSSMAPGASGLLSTMTSSAQRDLDAGVSLTPQMNTIAQQSARSAMAARGLNGNQAVAQEVLNSYRLGLAREDRARQYAGSVYGLGAGVADRAAATYGAPILSNVMSPGSLMGAASGMVGAQGPQFVQPESQYMAGVMGQQYSTQAQVNIARAQAQAGLQSGILSGLGAIGAAYVGRTT
jgi:hypothetical protein